MERILLSQKFIWVVLLAAYGLAASVEGRSTVVPRGYELVRDGEGRQHPPVTEPDDANKMMGTALFTSDGSMYTKWHDDGRRLPRSLTEIDAAHDYVSNTTILLNPALECEGCPTTDTRELVKDTTVAPWDAIGLLLREVKVAASDTIAQCSGTLIGARRQHVLTAAHCLIDNTNATAYSTILFFPAISGNTEPFKPIIAHQVRVLQQYVDAQGVSTASLDADFGLITLSSPAPEGTTAMNVAAGENRDMLINLQTAGYPADKPPQTMWSVECPSMSFAFSSEALLDCGGGCDNIVVHDCLSTGGQSGSPIFSMNGTRNYTTHAILTGALSLSDGVILNTATQINGFVYNTIASWYNEDITGGLLLSSPSALMPSSSLSSSTRSSSSYYRTNRGYSSRWWYFFFLLLAAAILVAAILFCIIRRRRTRANVTAAASYPAVAPYPTNTGTNFGQYGTPNFNSYGTSGQQGYTNTNVLPNNNSNYATGYPVSTPNFGAPTPYQASQYPTTYPQK